jgi:hypothetical protein
MPSGHSGTTLSAGESHLSADPGFSPPGSDSVFPAGREVQRTCSTWHTWLRRAHSAEVRLSEALLASLSPVTRVPPLGRQSLMRWSGRSSSLAALEATRWTQSGTPGRVRCELRRGLRRELRRQWSKVTAARRTWCSAACRLPARRWPRTPLCPSPVRQRRPPRARLSIADDLRVACAPRPRSSEHLRAGRSPRRRRCRRPPPAPGRARRTGSSPAPAAGRRGSRQYDRGAPHPRVPARVLRGPTPAARTARCPPPRLRASGPRRTDHPAAARGSTRARPGSSGSPSA